MSRFVSVSILAAVCLVMTVTASAGSGAVDNSVYARLLKEHVHQGLVDYSGLKEDEIRLDEYLYTLASTDTASLNERERFAYFINAYNAWTIKLILMNWPDVESIKDIGSFFTSPWELEFVSMNGEKVSLDYIEHEVLRPEFNDPRVHFVINCASLSCPPLASQPYEPDKLEKQLDRATGSYINDTHHNRLEENILYLSKIFDWFEDDFGGEDGVITFIRKYARPELAEKIIKRRRNLDVEYLDYDWGLNEW